MRTITVYPDNVLPSRNIDTLGKMYEKKLDQSDYTVSYRLKTESADYDAGDFLAYIERSMCSMFDCKDISTFEHIKDILLWDELGLDGSAELYKAVLFNVDAKWETVRALLKIFKNCDMEASLVDAHETEPFSFANTFIYELEHSINYYPFDRNRRKN